MSDTLTTPQPPKFQREGKGECTQCRREIDTLLMPTPTGERSLVASRHFREVAGRSNVLAFCMGSLEPIGARRRSE